MDYSQKIAERMWNLPDKGELESKREETLIDDIVQKSHLEKENSQDKLLTISKRSSRPRRTSLSFV